ncbi:PhzF family phenazine biosynthesis protein [Humitalea sp. 24SJ18S-53]|uniref:PhzF family phenazine biosynthesis protein n=1 Tax=Humitalea sp. 24SJ18S-53 TaxID=3422307 RepID=UPI003D678751
MRKIPFVTVDVFTDRRFGGNPLAVFPDARGLSDAEMQSLAAEFNLSETTFVLPPGDPANTARVRIFNRTAEMPFAGHPNVGTGFVLGQQGRARDGVLRFEELAGLVEVVLDQDGATIAAPQPLTLGATFPAAPIAACASIAAVEVLLGAHPPILAGMGNDFIIAEVTPSALTRAAPDIAAFRQARDATGHGGRMALLLYARDGDDLRARMFAPLSGTPEDPATGSANVALGALLLSLSDAPTLRIDVIQGVEMGRPSLLRIAAQRAPDGIRATVGGGCIEVLRGEALV